MASVLQGTLFLIGLMSAAWTDLRRRQIYDLSGIVIAGAGLISFSPARLLGLTLAVPFWLASRRGRGGMGDAFLIAASGFLLGFLRGVAGLVLALVLYCLFYGRISESSFALTIIRLHRSVYRYRSKRSSRLYATWSSEKRYDSRRCTSPSRMMPCRMSQSRKNRLFLQIQVRSG